MKLQLEITGILFAMLAMLHLRFPRYFNWKDDLKSTSLINRQMMYVHTFFIALILFLMGMLCLVGANDIISTRLGHLLAIGLFIFWGLRLYFQFFVYSTQLWRGKKLETIIHIVFCVLWTYFSALFFYIGFISEL